MPHQGPHRKPPEIARTMVNWTIAAGMIVGVWLILRWELRAGRRPRARRAGASTRRRRDLEQAEATADVERSLAALESSPLVGAQPSAPRRGRRFRTYAGPSPIGLFLMAAVGFLWFTALVGFPGSLLATALFFAVAGCAVASSRADDQARLASKRRSK